MVDFRFVWEHCKDFYADWGRDAWDPLLMFKMVLLQPGNVPDGGQLPDLIDGHAQETTGIRPMTVKLTIPISPRWGRLPTSSAVAAARVVLVNPRGNAPRWKGSLLKVISAMG